MGRKATRNKNLPAGMRARHRPTGTYYYLDSGGTPRKEIPLGKDYALAVQEWAKLKISKPVGNALITFRYVAERYQQDVIPSKAPATRKDNLRELAQLYKFFDAPPVPLDEIEPINIKQYLEWRKSAKVRANREKALFSHIWNYAREAGLTNKANPCQGVKGHKETGRSIYVDEAILQMVRVAAEPPLRDAIDLAYLTGQRPADVLKLSRNDIADGELTVVQNKTGMRLRIAIEGELALVIEKIGTRKAIGQALVNTRQGYPMSAVTLRGAFDRARDAAVAANPEREKEIRAFQFRDLRAKAGTDKEESSGMAAAKDQLGHTTETMTAHYVRHRRGKLVKPTR
jgi:integrase